MDIDTFYNLTPAEVALLWLSPDESPQSDDSTRIICSKPTILIGCLLAEGFAATNGDINQEMLNQAIENYSKVAVDSMLSKNFIVRYDFGMRQFLYFLDKANFPLSIDENIKTKIEFKLSHGFSKDDSSIMIPSSFDLAEYKKEKSKYSQIYHRGANLFESALLSMEDKNLVIDPPWLNKKTAATAFAVILLGSIPLDISIKTSKGRELIKTVKVETTFWGYNKISSSSYEESHINIKIARFLEGVITDLSKSLLNNWSHMSNVQVPSQIKDDNHKTDSNLSLPKKLIK